jgi:hypothetical protein
MFTSSASENCSRTEEEEDEVDDEASKSAKQTIAQICFRSLTVRRAPSTPNTPSRPAKQRVHKYTSENILF